MEKLKLIKKDKILRLPEKPGIYAFLNKKELLYIGKAINIKKRVKNHFQKSNQKDGLFIKKTDKIGFMESGSEIEALILEARLIKKYRPKFNVIWKDDKNYFYICFTKENFPRIFITHQVAKNNPLIKCLGPFVDGEAIKQVLKILRKIFPYKSCKNMPKKSCLFYQLKRCPAPCLLNNNLARQLPKVAQKTKKISQKNIFNIIKIFEGKGEKILKDTLKKMRMAAKAKDFEEAIRLRDRAGFLERILAHSPVFQEKEEKPGWEKIKKNLTEIFKDKKGFHRIEAYDISNFQGKEATGSLVVFIEGRPEKNLYRKFKIKFSGEKPNDILMLKEIIKRRLNHKEWPLPDLVLIDGGKAQLNLGLKEFNGKKIKIMSLAKKNNELFLAFRKKPVLLKNLPSDTSNLILRIRDEAHRFAISYHRNLRKKRLFS